MDDRTPIEFAVREPTGLELGTFDIFLIRQKIYEGELQPRCEFQDADGQWRPMLDHPALAEVLWLKGVDGDKDAARRVSRFGGWQVASKDSPGHRSSVRLAGQPADKGEKAGLLGRFFKK
jgi:hypothetical protein